MFSMKRRTIYAATVFALCGIFAAQAPAALSAILAYARGRRRCCGAGSRPAGTFRPSAKKRSGLDLGKGRCCESGPSKSLWTC